MAANFKKAIKDFGISDYGRWLLPDGNFLNVGDGDDHRIVGYYCRNDWREFIKDGAMSLHYDPRSNYLWIRTIGLTVSQQSAMRMFIEEYGNHVQVLKVDLYDFETWKDYNVESFEISDSEMAKLYLTDKIAYNVYKSEMEYNEDDY